MNDTMRRAVEVWARDEYRKAMERLNRATDREIDAAIDKARRTARLAEMMEG